MVQSMNGRYRTAGAIRALIYVLTLCKFSCCGVARMQDDAGGSKASCHRGAHLLYIHVSDAQRLLEQQTWSSGRIVVVFI